MMSLPLMGRQVAASILEYKKHYESTYCRAEIYTLDNIRVYFNAQKFGHAFYENSQHRSGPKEQFSPERAQRMDWIKSTLMHPDALLFFGWNKDTSFALSSCSLKH